MASGVLAAIDPSTPSTGQKNRFRALPRGSNLALSPVDGAEFLAGQKFDISIELHAEGDKAEVPDLSKLKLTINGKEYKDVLVEAPKAPYLSNYTSNYYADQEANNLGKKTAFTVARASWRFVSLPKSGDYTVEISAGSEKVKAVWTVKGSSTRKVKNALLFIGDGMAPTMISAARYLSRNTKFGKFSKGDGFLEMEKWDAMGKISTNGLDSIITDSANSAATYSSGQKGWVNTLNVYADTTTGDDLDDPKVEIITEVIRRVRPGMCIGVVSTASIVDATPAAFYSHTRSRGQGDIIADQALNGFKHWKQTDKATNTWTVQGESMPWGPAVKPDVMFGGGGERFSGIKSLNSSDLYAQFKTAGYNVVHSKTDLKGVTSGPVLGIFAAQHMDTWYERTFNLEGLKVNPNSGPKNDKTTASDQPGLEEMTLKAIEIMEKKCKDGWFLMSEAASIDKAMHPLDYDRGLADLLELDRTLHAVRNLPSAKETAIFLTADHSQAFDVYGSVDLGLFRKFKTNDDSVGVDGKPNTLTDKAVLQAEQRTAVGVYQDAGWPDNILDENGLPTKFKDARYRLAAGKVDTLNHVENFEFKKPVKGQNPLVRKPSVLKNQTELGFHDVKGQVVFPDDSDSVEGLGLIRTSNLAHEESQSVHSLQAVDLYCYGPVAASCAKVMDNTDLFFAIADALGLGDKPDVVPASSTCAAYTATTTVTGYSATATVTVTTGYSATPTATVTVTTGSPATATATVTVTTGYSATTASTTANKPGNIIANAASALGFSLLTIVTGAIFL
ncbi:alkaline-phosphatase-like protein [Obelidium mucronatum]|nr:alkaline-phosphatase-like protein [Obelidium mucronatum]